MHEVTTTVKQNADNAQAANQLAVAARDTAEKGGSVVSEAVAAVSQIEDSAKRSEEHTSELQSLMRISYAVFCLKKKKTREKYHITQKVQTHNKHKITKRTEQLKELPHRL